MSLQDGSTVAYLCSEGYAPERERGVHPLDPDVGIRWPSAARDGSPVSPLLSDKDTAAPTLREAAEQGLLPTANEAAGYVASLRSG
jgi:dTDP-4-dehydrorhamnose 3,5-epimerase